MANERLRVAITTHGFALDDVARELQVNVKTVERWIAGRAPHRQTRYQIAALLGEDVSYLWPDALSPIERQDVAEAEIVGVYAHRSLVPAELWIDFFARAKVEIGVLVHAGGFLAENNRIHRALRDAAAAGATVRMLFGDPDSEEVLRRGSEEGLGEGVAYKVRNALALFRPLLDAPGVEGRFHRSSLHNSIFWSDDEMLINTQIYGVSAPSAPVLHLRKVSGAELVAMYQRSFNKVWDESAPIDRQG